MALDRCLHGGATPRSYADAVAESRHITGSIERLRRAIEAAQLVCCEVHWDEIPIGIVALADMKCALADLLSEVGAMESDYKEWSERQSAEREPAPGWSGAGYGRP